MNAKTNEMNIAQKSFIHSRSFYYQVGFFVLHLHAFYMYYYIIYNIYHVNLLLID